MVAHMLPVSLAAAFARAVAHTQATASDNMVNPFTVTAFLSRLLLPYLQQFQVWLISALSTVISNSEF